MLKLPEDILDKALATLVEGIPGLDYESQPTPLTQLSQKEEALKFVQHAFYSHVQKRMLPIHRQINQLLPIYKLPDELLQQIFLGACELEYAVSRYRSSTRLAAVSRRWRSVATSYARLWNFLHSETNLEAMKLMLQRCTSAPLDLFCSCLSRPKARAFFDLLTPLSTRWRSLKFNYDNVDRLSLDFLTGRSLPLLEHLTLPTMGYELRDRALSNRNLGIIAPSLRELEAHRHPLPLRLDHGIPSTLTTLIFTAAINGAPFLPIDFYTLLKSTPHLQHLTIWGFLNADFPDPDVAGPMRIDLPCLDILGLNELGGTTIGFLLSSIVTPSSCYPQVMVRGERYDSLSSLSPLENSLLKGFSRSYRSSLMSAGATFGVRMELGAADDWRCLLYLSSFDTNSPAEDLSIIIAVLLSGIRKLEIDGLELLLHGLSDRLHLLPLLEELKIYSQESDDYPELRDALKQTITKFASGSSPDQPSQVICPLLRRIVLDTFHFDMDCVVKLVLVRTPAEVEEFKNKVRLELVELGEQFEPDDPTLGMLHQLATDRNVELRVGKLSEW